MKKALSLLILMLTVPVLVFCTLSVNSAESAYLYDSAVIPNGSMIAIAHRGYSDAAPENTLPAFRLAGENGFWGAECDIQRTADGQWVLMHDPKVDRMTDGKGEVSAMRFDELRALTIDAGSNVSQYPDTGIPTLEEYLDVCSTYGLHAVIEIKESVKEEDLPALAAILNTRPEKENFILISYVRELLTGMQALMSETPVWLLTKRTTKDDIAFCVEHGIAALDFSHKKTSTEMVRAAQNAGLDTAAWTVNKLSTAEDFYLLGVKTITTNGLLPKKSAETK